MSAHYQSIVIVMQSLCLFISTIQTDMPIVISIDLQLLNKHLLKFCRILTHDDINPIDPAKV